MIRRDWLPAAGPLHAHLAYPSRPVTLIVPFAPGGVADITARALAQAIGRSLDQTVVVDNRPSAGSIVAGLAVTGQRRNAALPEVPTAIGQGLSGYDVESWNALAAPADAPPAVIDHLHRTAEEQLAWPKVSQRLAELGVRPQRGTPAQL